MIIPLEFQDELKKILEKHFLDYRTLKGDRLSIYKQNIPVPENGENENPYILIMFQDGNTKDINAADVTVRFIIGIRDDSINNQGYVDCFNILNKIYNLLTSNSVILDNFEMKEEVNWATSLFEDVMSSYPFYFMGLDTVWRYKTMSLKNVKGEIYI